MSWYEKVMSMHETTRNAWIKNALLFGLSCVCRTDKPGCAKHDERIQKLLADEEAKHGST